MTDQDQNDQISFGDIEEDDAYCPDDPKLEDIDWEQVEKLQGLIDNLPKDGEERRAAVYDLQAELNKDS